MNWIWLSLVVPATLLTAMNVVSMLVDVAYSRKTKDHFVTAAAWLGVVIYSWMRFFGV